MQWMNEMFANMQKERSAPSLRTADEAKADRTEHPRNRAAQSGWDTLVSAITRDVNYFNNRKERSGHTLVRISQRHFQCEVHLSGMQGKTLALALEDRGLQVSVHPDFPVQQRTIKLDEAQAGFWILGLATKESAKLSCDQLSEYLLKPILSSAAINREV
jgi:hypothetical protein